MNLLSAENLSHSAGDKVLFQNLNFGLNRGNRVGLIGVNGTGKSTLLRILARLQPPDSGLVSIRKETRIGFLDQHNEFGEDEILLNAIFKNNHPLSRVVWEYESLAGDAAEGAAESDRLDQASAAMTEAQAWEYYAQVKKAITLLGLPAQMHLPLKSMSGGQRKRAAIARLFAEQPDVVILDEPTNHLDLDTVEHLQHLITDLFDTMIVVTHDRYFLDAVTNTIVELDQGQLFRYDGNYAYFLEKKAAREEAQAAELDKARNLYRRELEWMRRQPKARTTKSRARIDSFTELKEKVSVGRKEADLQLEVKQRYQGNKILEAKNVSKSLGGKKLIEGFTHHFQRAERVGILGPNGTGKTTLLRLIVGELQPDTGTLTPGDNTRFGYYSQEFQFSPAEMGRRIIEIVTDIAETIETVDGSKINAAQFLTRFKFPPKDQYKYVEKLSGGERKRLQLLRVLVGNPNFLILDEPTNDLDITTLNVLEEFLESFTGTVLLVSHDRYFMDRLVDHVFVFEGDGKIKDFPGNYTEYRNWKEEQEEAEKAKKKAEASAQPPTTETQSAAKTGKRKLSFKEQQQLKDSEEAIARLEARKEEIHQLLNGGTNDHQQLAALGRELTTLEKEYDAAMETWLTLSDLIS